MKNCKKLYERREVNENFNVVGQTMREIRKSVIKSAQNEWIRNNQESIPYFCLGVRQTTHVYGVWHVFAGVYITFLSLRLEEKETLKYRVCRPPPTPPHAEKFNIVSNDYGCTQGFSLAWKAKRLAFDGFLHPHREFGAKNILQTITHVIQYTRFRRIQFWRFSSGL